MDSYLFLVEGDGVNAENGVKPPESGDSAARGGCGVLGNEPQLKPSGALKVDAAATLGDTLFAFSTAEVAAGERWDCLLRTAPPRCPPERTLGGVGAVEGRTQGIPPSFC